MGLHLENMGFTLVETSTLEKGIECIQTNKFDLILINLAIMIDHGFQVFEEIQKISCDIPIVVIMRPNGTDSLIKLLHLGACDFILEPIVDIAVVEHTICRALERGRLLLENKRYRRELQEKNIELTRSLGQLKEDQKAGKSVQQQLLPRSNVQYGDYCFSYKMMPSLYLSGDSVDYFEIDDNKIAFYIIDVSGHGASSAFVTIMIKNIVEKSYLKYKVSNDETILYPNKILKEINDAVASAKLGKYLTMVFCILDKKQSLLQYCIGGHYPSPILFNGKKPFYLEGRGYAVGVFKDAKFDLEEYRLPEEFTLSLFSDGVFEIIQGKNSQEKENHLLAAVEATNNSIDNLTNLLNIEKEYGFPDDITLLIVSKKHCELSN